MRKEIRVCSLVEYVDAVKEIYNENAKRNINTKSKHLFFRGQSKESYKLIPAVLRNHDLKEKELVNDFVHFGPQYNINYNFDDIVNILTDMQHAEISTRLLDWSIAPLSALFFAICDKVKEGERDEEDATVTVFNPWEYNKK